MQWEVSEVRTLEVVLTETDFAIETSVVMKPFKETIILNTNQDFYGMRDVVAEVLKRRPQDLELGYTCSWWKVAEKATPASLRTAESWMRLVEDIKLWLAADKKQVATKWGIMVVDKDDLGKSGSSGKETKEKKVCGLHTCLLSLNPVPTRLLLNPSNPTPHHPPSSSQHMQN